MLKTLNGIRLIRFEPEIHSQQLYYWYYSGDYPEYYRNYPTCPSMQEIAASSVGKTFMIQADSDNGSQSAIVGCIMHFSEKEFARNFEVGILVDKQFQNNSFGINSLKILLNWKFNNCNLYKAKVNCVFNNKKLIKIVEKFGFQLEGTLKKEAFYDGEFHDIAGYAMFKKDFNLRYKKEFIPIEARLEAPILKVVHNGQGIAGAI